MTDGPSGGQRSATLLTQAHAALKSGRAGDAVRLLTRAAIEQPHHPGALHLLGMALERQGDPAAELPVILARQPGHTEAWRLLGNTLASAGDLPAAKAAFRRAVEINPGDAAALLDLVLAGRIVDADRPLLDWIAAASAQPDIPPRGQVLLGFALGKAYDDLHEPEHRCRAYEPWPGALRSLAE